MEGDILRSLPPGYKFKPRDEELVDFYLKRKIYKRLLPPNIFRDVDLYKYDPLTLTEMCDNASSNGIITEWYFFTPRDRKYPKGSRPMRSAGDGYWKATGKPIPVISRGEEIGSKRSLVYCRGKSAKGEKTDWIMHEYVLTKAPPRQRRNEQDMQLDDCVLCRVYKRREARSKSGIPVEGSNDKEQEEAYKGEVAQNEGQMLENEISPDSTVMPQQTSSMLPQFSESFGARTMPAPMASMPLYHQFQLQVPPLPQFSGAGPSNLNFTASDGFFLDVQQVEVDNDAIVAKSEAGVMENGILPDCLNTMMPQQTLSMICLDEFDDYYLPEYPESFDSMSGENPTSFNRHEAVSDYFNFTSMPTPLASMPPYYQFQPLCFEPQVFPQQQQLSGDYRSNFNFTEADGFVLDFEQENADDSAVVAKSEAQNGIPRFTQCKEFDDAALNMVMPQKPV
ncbi:hypothetical protein F3Y22_tig00110020pilonHSYRG00515 [Hibiscus syriacus]|uniref:NAC domain-containing protein n=1 Tax=Hibiscus syriacus TaxID=106335 RepID=A0A6A3BM50_HIBSY|nr:NAC domain-containing protein 2-like [Hibiscus syriacus]KAE8718056.1 hypothetical protein F3Y22_tig00110020pilonHSYRG00515 [Hibiscus syriacus]